MSVLTSEPRLVGSGTALLPRVNLLPPEIGEKRAFRRVQMGLGVGLVAAVGVVGLLYTSASHSVTSANEDLATAQTQNTTLQAEAAKFRNVTALYAAADAAQQQLTLAMGDEVRYSQLLNDLSLTVPSNVWVNNMAFTQAAAAAGAAPVGRRPTIGTFTVSGTGFAHDDVAVWLESIAGLKTYDSPYFSTSTESLLGTKPIVTFSSTANLTAKALSGRYTKPAGG